MGWVLVILIILFLLFTEELYRYIFCRKSSALFEKLFDSKGHEPEYYAYREAGEKKLRQLPHFTFTMDSDRGEPLKGFYYSCGGEGHKIAFIVHGYRSDHADTGGIAYDYYASRGFDVFTCDHTAAGESGGNYIGFDVFECQDCLKWIDFLKEKFGEDIQIVLHGFSMGAATVMQMSGHCPENVKFIAEDSGYKNAKAAMLHQVGPMFEPLRFLNQAIAGYDWNDSDVTESLAHSRIPMLFFHGREDKLVPFQNGPELYELYQGPKECFFPEEVKHIECMYCYPEECARLLDSYMEKYIQ